MGTTAEPVMHRRNELSASMSRSAVFRIVWNTAGAPGTTEMRSSTARRSSDGTSNTACGMLTAPRMRQARMPELSPAECRYAEPF